METKSIHLTKAFKTSDENDLVRQSPAINPDLAGPWTVIE
jgi:hypothetical protein